jgi:hypothetical protein
VSDNSGRGNAGVVHSLQALFFVHSSGPLSGPLAIAKQWSHIRPQAVASAVCRYLSRLLLLHGRWSYLRNEEVVLYSFYKNWAYVLVYVYLQFEVGPVMLQLQL